MVPIVKADVPRYRGNIFLELTLSFANNLILSSSEQPLYTLKQPFG